jgi:surface polysaccharide O-acyltransferase-like enzyme
MNKQKMTVAICLGIYAVLAIVVAITSGAERGGIIGLFGILASIFYLLVGLAMCISKHTREVGKAILLSAGLVLLIGVGVCSLYPLNFGR